MESSSLTAMRKFCRFESMKKYFVSDELVERKIMTVWSGKVISNPRGSNLGKRPTQKRVLGTLNTKFYRRCQVRYPQSYKADARVPPVIRGLFPALYVLNLISPSRTDGISSSPNYSSGKFS